MKCHVCGATMWPSGAYRTHEYKDTNVFHWNLNENQPINDAGTTPCESPRPVSDARLTASRTPERPAEESVAQSSPASPQVADYACDIKTALVAAEAALADALAIENRALREALSELLAAMDDSVRGDDDVAAMLRYGKAEKIARRLARQKE